MKKIILITFILLAGTSIVQAQKTILFFGDSITAGFGVDPDQAFPTLIQHKIDELNWNYSVVNGGVSGETSAGGLRRIDWVLGRKYDVMILELGGNDGLRGIDLVSTRSNLQQIIDKARAKYPEITIIIAGMQVPPNLGEDYTSDFAAIFPELAKKNDLPLIPFVLENVGGIAELNQPDGIHPTVEGHIIVAETVWQTLMPILKSQE